MEGKRGDDRGRGGGGGENGGFGLFSSLMAPTVRI